MTILRSNTLKLIYKRQEHRINSMKVNLNNLQALNGTKQNNLY